MSSRKAHVLDPTHGATRPGQVIFFDTITRPIPENIGIDRHVLRLGAGQFYRAGIHGPLEIQAETVFRDPGAFITWMDARIRPRSTCYLVAHNIVYHLCMVDAWQAFPAAGWEMTSFYTRGNVSIFRWSSGSRHLIGLDNTNLFAGPLAKWGSILNTPVLDLDPKTATDEDLLTGIRQDLKIQADLWKLWLTFLDDQACGSFKVTIGSTAFNTWRHSYLKAHVWVHSDPAALQLERESYRGARVEVLYKGRLDQGPYYYLDVNNMYGYVMGRYEYPAALLGSTDHADISYLIRKLSKYSVIARVAVNVDDNPYPHKFESHTCYPLGRFVTTLTTPELILAIERGWLVGVDSMAWYRSAPLFHDYVKHWYVKRLEYRQAGNKPMEALCKLFINSLYGKFGQAGFMQREIGAVDPYEVYSMQHLNIDTGEYSRLVALGGKLYEETKQGESHNSLPAIAAHITANARLYLWRLLRMAGSEHCYYVDTDSLLVDQAGWNNLRSTIAPVRLGSLKPEVISQWAEIRAPKDYALEGRERIKGIRADAEILADGGYGQDQYDHLRGLLEAGDIGKYHVRRIVKHQARRIYSGQLSPSGWVVPWSLAEFAEYSPVRIQLPALQPELF